MKTKIIFIALFLSLGFGAVTLSGCSAGGRIGPVGGSASVG